MSRFWEDAALEINKLLIIKQGNSTFKVPHFHSLVKIKINTE